MGYNLHKNEVYDITTYYIYIYCLTNVLFFQMGWFNHQRFPLWHHGNGGRLTPHGMFWAHTPAIPEAEAARKTPSKAESTGPAGPFLYGRTNKPMLHGQKANSSGSRWNFKDLLAGTTRGRETPAPGRVKSEMGQLSAS